MTLKTEGSPPSLMKKKSATEAAGLGREMIHLVNFDRHFPCVYPKFATARVYYRNYEDGRMACDVENAYLSLTKIHGPQAPNPNSMYRCASTQRRRQSEDYAFGRFGVSIGSTTRNLQ